MSYPGISRIVSGIRGLRPGKSFPAPFPLCVPRPSPAGRRAGVTLVELMISVAILSIGIAGLVQSFGFIQKAVQGSKNKTLASNLAQEKMQILKQKTYYQILVTSDPVHNITDFPPEDMAYDSGYFPPETIVEAGVSYTRYTYVQALREDSGELVDIAPTVMDTGIKRITIHVVWGYGTGKKKVTMRSMVSNPETVMANVAYTGTVVTTGGAAIPNALVGLVESPGCTDTTSSLGVYYMNGTPGTYTLQVTATGYYPLLQSVVSAAAETKTNDF
ncbi:MAG: prepilin-type N-terminal cleavage/methylation domain-containing protein, partial [Elusimicrobiales bacterium]|nr:prepilin-type N-terminal cleavage/methylation domain-containing protein [Elusimicrobiales bacterium]